MTEPNAGHLRVAAVTADDAALLRALRCGRIDAPWTVEAEDYIHLTLPSELRSGGTRATGLWNGNDLVAVAAWRMETAPPVCRCFCLATTLAWQRRGCARRLKTSVLAQAKAEGKIAVTSFVHEDNAVMRRLNAELGGIEDSPDEDGYHLISIRVS